MNGAGHSGGRSNDSTPGLFPQPGENSIYDGILEDAREKEVRVTNSYNSKRDGPGSLC